MQKHKWEVATITITKKNGQRAKFIELHHEHSDTKRTGETFENIRKNAGYMLKSKGGGSPADQDFVDALDGEISTEWFEGLSESQADILKEQHINGIDVREFEILNQRVGGARVSEKMKREFTAEVVKFCIERKEQFGKINRTMLRDLSVNLLMHSHKLSVEEAVAEACDRIKSGNLTT